MPANVYMFKNQKVYYSVHITQDSYGVESFTVTDVTDTDRDRLSVAAALREVANMLEAEVGKPVSD